MLIKGFNFEGGGGGGGGAPLHHCLWLVKFHVQIVIIMKQ